MHGIELWVATLLFAGVGAANAGSSGSAAAVIARLSPAKIPNVPLGIVRELERRGCTVPQPWGAEVPENVVMGSFAKVGQRDYAVLCSRGEASEIQVFWGGPAWCPSTVTGSTSADENFVQAGEAGRAEYSRALSVSSPTSIARHRDDSGGTQTPIYDHDGIDDGFAGKGSIIRYCYRGAWIELPGSD